MTDTKSVIFGKMLAIMEPLTSDIHTRDTINKNVWFLSSKKQEIRSVESMPKILTNETWPKKHKYERIS